MILKRKKQQATGIEPASSAWEADVLPMYYACMNKKYYSLFYSFFQFFSGIFLKTKKDRTACKSCTAFDVSSDQRGPVVSPTSSSV